MVRRMHFGRTKPFICNSFVVSSLLAVFNRIKAGCPALSMRKFALRSAQPVLRYYTGSRRLGFWSSQALQVVETTGAVVVALDFAAM